MSFAEKVRNNLSRIENSSADEDKAELLGLLKMSGSIIVRDRLPGIKFVTENAALARRVIRTIKNYYGVQTQIVVGRARRLKKNNVYQVLVVPSPAVAQALDELRLITLDVEEPKQILRRTDAKKAFLRGAFLGGGTVNSPCGQYHLELVTGSESFARILISVMRSVGVRGKTVSRGDKFVVYLKKVENIVLFLGLIGAYSAVLEFENSRVLKDVRKNVNRVVNCETANLSKVAKAAALHIRAISYVEEHYGLVTLPKNVQDAAKTRLLLPEASLAELCEQFGGISKSSMSMYLKRIVDLAVSLGMKKEYEQC
ncbi:MAG: DNA-binding protein WhiA [Acidaminococcaceae bacterium]|nr:DNA-binding protein WhiA [Acidaminococcaceae bacterium]